MQHDSEKKRQDDNKQSASTSVSSWISENKAIVLAGIFGIISSIAGAVISVYPQLINKPSLDEYNDDYVVSHSFYYVSLEGFNPLAETNIGTEKSIVAVTRIDSIIKNKDTQDDYFLPFYTTGERIELKTIKSSGKVNFEEVKNLDEKYRHSYELKLPIGNKPVGYNETMHNLFTFINGFRNDKEEWWVASVKYPTKAIGIHIRCPQKKPCKGIKVYRRKGISAPQEILDNPAFLSDNGYDILWMGDTEKPDTRILFQWNW